jgi:hypothetical protein
VHKFSPAARSNRVAAGSYLCTPHARHAERNHRTCLPLEGFDRVLSPGACRLLAERRQLAGCGGRVRSGHSDGNGRVNVDAFEGERRLEGARPRPIGDHVGDLIRTRRLRVKRQFAWPSGGEVFLYRFIVTSEELRVAREPPRCVNVHALEGVLERDTQKVWSLSALLLIDAFLGRFGGFAAPRAASRAVGAGVVLTFCNASVAVRSGRPGVIGVVGESFVLVGRCR